MKGRILTLICFFHELIGRKFVRKMFRPTLAFVFFSGTVTLAQGLPSGPNAVDLSSSAFQEREIPEWCKPLPRPEYKSLQRIPVSDPWFEVYKVAPNTIAIYEPHQSEETISYLILGKDRALLLDTGMGISDLRKVVSELTPLPIIVVNSTLTTTTSAATGNFHDLFHGHGLQPCECQGFHCGRPGGDRFRRNLR